MCRKARAKWHVGGGVMWPINAVFYANRHMGEGGEGGENATQESVQCC